MSQEQAGFGQAALAQLPAELDAETPTKKGAGQKRKPAEVPQPTRRSLRESRKLTPKAAAALAGEDEGEDEEELNEEVEHARALRSAKTATRPRKPKATPEEEAAELDAHNRNRISSMDEGKLRTRIKRISNVAKLKSFIAALEESGKTGLAAEARAKLVHLQTGEPADSNLE